MTPNVASVSSGPSRRSFLASTAVAAAAVAGGMPLLTACGESDSGSREGTTSGKAADKLLPTYAASTIAKPDLLSRNGSSAGYIGKVDLAALASSVPDKLGTGAPLKIMSPLWGTPPKPDCAYYKALDAEAGTKITWQNQDAITYGEKLGAVLASSSIPDMVVVPSWELAGKISNAVTAKFMDLGPYLAGDKVKKYPNLAAIPSDSWRMSIFGGALRGIPMPAASTPGIVPFYRKDVFDKKGYTVPKSADEFRSWAKEATSAKAKVWACGDMRWSAAGFFGVQPAGSLGWNIGDDGKLTYRIEHPEYLEHLEWVRKLFAAGVVHPDDKANTGDAGQRFTAGEILVYNQNMSDWYGRTTEQAQSNPDFEIEGMDYFGADGGKPTLYAGQPASIWSMIRKGASKETVENALAAANFAAAPYGTKERMYVDYGVEGTHYTVTDGVPIKNDRGLQEVNNAWVLLAAPAPYLAHPDFPEVTHKQVEWQQRQGALVKKTSWGDSDGTADKPNLYRTSDGKTWKPVPGQPAGTAAKVPIRAAYDRHTRELYVTYANAPGPNGQSDGSVHKLRTVNGKWTEVTPVKPGGTATDGSTDSFGYGGVAVDARRPGTLVVSTNNRWAEIDTVFRSTNGGRTWTSLKDRAVLDVSETPYLKWGGDTAKFGWWIQALGLDPYDSEHVVYGTGATLYGTRDLRHWAPQIRGVEEAAIRLLVSPPTGEAHLISGNGDIGVMYHERLTASPSRGMASNPVFGTCTGLSLAPAKPSYVVRAGWGNNGNGAYSNDGGKTWTPFATQPAIAKDAPGPIATSADGSVLLWSFAHWDGTKYAAHRSMDNGATWSEVASFPKGAAPIADPVDPTRFYAFDTTTGTVFASTDGGRTFTAGATGLATGDAEFQLKAAPGRTGDLWLSLKANGLFRSTDAGATFTKVSSCQASHTLGFGKAAEGASYPAIYMVGAIETFNAVYRSHDEAKTWTRINDDQHQWGWTGAAITGDPRVYGRVYLGTNGRGVQYGDPA